ISYSMHRIHHHTDYWVPDGTEEIDPDRFIASRNQKHPIPNPFDIFLPFNTG
ncbi:hypothetical protein BDY19DRAFT_864429, partial [Irpex rosettiformis]